MRLAHFSDIHVTRSPLAEPLALLHGKRALGLVNWAIGRHRHFAGTEERIAALLADVDAQAVDHVLCTGDLTSMSYEDEFARCAELFGPRLHAPLRFTAIAGNHDRYTQGAVDDRRFERYFGSLASSSGDYPAVKRVAPGVTMVLIDVCRPTMFDSSGFCGEPQLRALEAILVDPSLRSEFVIVALHYGLLKHNGAPDRPTHRIEDYEALLALLVRADAHVDLVLHGHIHRDYALKIGRRAFVCAGSATDLAVDCGYNVYDIDVAARRFTTQRRVWNAATSSFAALATTPAAPALELVR